MGKSKGVTQRKTIPVRQLLLLIPLCFFAMYSGNIIGYLLQMIVSFLVPFFIIPQTAVATAENPVLQALLVTFVSPFMEEVIF